MDIQQVILNCRFGPDKDEGLRYEQFKESTRKFFTEQTPTSSALRQAWGPKILSEMGNLVQRNSPGHPLEALFKYLKRDFETETKGIPVSMARFMNFRRAGEDLLHNWTWTQLRGELLALDEDMLPATSSTKAIVTQRALMHADDVCSTSLAQTALDAKILRSCLQNNVATLSNSRSPPASSLRSRLLRLQH